MRFGRRGLVSRLILRRASRLERARRVGPARAEFAMALIFAAAKRFPDTWIGSPDAWRPQALGKVAGETLGLYGLGSIAEALTPMARSLGMKVLATRRTSATLPHGVEHADDLADHVRRSRYSVLAAPLTPGTRGVLNAAALRDARGLHVINPARGARIDDAALLDAVADRRVVSAFLDMIEPEPLPEGHAFYGQTRIHVSPHRRCSRRTCRTGCWTSSASTSNGSVRALSRST